MSLELSDVDDRDPRLTRVEIWRIALLAAFGALFVIGIAISEMLLMH
jgi:hypothetical protein